MGSISSDNQQVGLVLRKEVVERLDHISKIQGMSRSSLMARMIETSLQYEEEIAKALERRRNSDFSILNGKDENGQ